MTETAPVLALFDWNGTVMDDLDRALAATNEAIATHGLGPLTRTEFQATFTLPLTTWIEELGVPDTESDRTRSRWNAAMAAPATPRVGTATMLREIRRCGGLTGVVTAADAISVHGDMERHGLESHFDVVETSVTDKRLRLAELRPLGVRAFYVGDTAYDITCARAAGYTAVSIEGGYQAAHHLAEAGADHHIEGFARFRDVWAGANAFSGTGGRVQP